MKERVRFDSFDIMRGLAMMVIFMFTLVLTTMLAHLISKYLPVLAGK